MFVSILLVMLTGATIITIAYQFMTNEVLANWKHYERFEKCASVSLLGMIFITGAFLMVSPLMMVIF